MATFIASGTRFQLNDEEYGSQGDVAVAQLADGSHIAAWSSQSGEYLGLEGWDTYSVFARHFDANGHPLGDEFRVNDYRVAAQSAPVVTALEDGGWLIAWTGAYGFNASGISGKKFDANGTQTGSFVIPSSMGPGGVQMVALEGGGFAVSWTEYDTNSSDPYSPYNIRVQLLDGALGAVGDAIAVNQLVLESQYYPGLTALEGGGFVVVWESYVGSSRTPEGEGSWAEVYGRVFDATGKPLGDEFRMGGNLPDEAGNKPSVAALPDGGFVAAWAYGGNAGFSGVSANQRIAVQEFDANGIATSDLMVLDQDWSYYGGHVTPEIAVLPDSGYVVIWASRFRDDPGDGQWKSGIFGQRFDADGKMPGARFIVQIESGDLKDPTVTMLEDGNFLVGWEGPDASGSGVFAKLVDMSKPMGKVIFGTESNDTLQGGPGDDMITSKGGNDLVIPGDGNDTVFLGAGNNTLWAGAGDTGADLLIIEGSGQNIVAGGAGNDTIEVNGHGNNLLFGGADDDLIAINGNGQNTAWAGTGADLIEISGDGDNTVGGGAGDDTIRVLGDGDTIIYGGTGSDLIEISGHGDNQIFGGGLNPGGAMTSNEITITGSGANEVFNGAGDDVVIIGAGAVGDNLLWGGAGNDLFEFADPGAKGTVAFTSGNGHDSITGFALASKHYVDFSNMPGVFASAADVHAAISATADGGAVITVSASQSVTLDIAAADLIAADPMDWLIL